MNCVFPNPSTEICVSTNPLVNSFLCTVGIGDNKKIRLTILKRPLSRSGGGFRSDTGVNDEKLANNIHRAKRHIYEYAMCNAWGLFFTGTLDKTKYDRCDLPKFHKDFTQFVRDQSKKYHCKIKFLVIPELHDDGESWHFHGFLLGFPSDALHRFRIGDKMSKAIADKVKRGEIVYKWLDYDKKFGFCDLEPIKNQDAISKYITKYINKNLASCVTELGAHLYYLSRGLNRATDIKKGYIQVDPKSFDDVFESEYSFIATFPYSDELLDSLKSSIL